MLNHLPFVYLAVEHEKMFEYGYNSKKILFSRERMKRRFNMQGEEVSYQINQQKSPRLEEFFYVYLCL